MANIQLKKKRNKKDKYKKTIQDISTYQWIYLWNIYLSCLFMFV